MHDAPLVCGWAESHRVLQSKNLVILALIAYLGPSGIPGSGLLHTELGRVKV